MISSKEQIEAITDKEIDNTDLVEKLTSIVDGRLHHVALDVLLTNPQVEFESLVEKLKTHQVAIDQKIKARKEMTMAFKEM